MSALLLFHHVFNRTDEDLDELMSDLAPAEFAVSAAVQGASLAVSADRGHLMGGSTR